MPRASRFTIPLSEEDRLEIVVEKEGGMVEGFVVNYVATIAGRDVSIVRYDTRHGFPHKDVIGANGRVERKVPLPHLDGHALVDLAVDDLKANWRTYRRRFGR